MYLFLFYNIPKEVSDILNIIKNSIRNSIKNSIKSSMNLDISGEFLKQINDYNEKFRPKILFGLPMYGGKCFTGFFSR